MGIFDFFFKKNTALETGKTQTQTIDRHKIPAEKIESDKKVDASQEYRSKIYKKYYSSYPEKPFISKDREENTNWEKQAEMFPNSSFVKKEMMYRYKDGLLPGHVYMLYWINKAKSHKNVPAYFEYEYGINFYSELKYLKENGYLETDHILTEKGVNAIECHHSVIDKRNPKPKSSTDYSKSQIHIIDCGRTISDEMVNGLSSIPASDKQIIFREIDLINDIAQKAKTLSGIKESLTIDKQSLDFRQKNTFYEFCSQTPTGRKKKLPLTLHYACKGHGNLNPPKDYFGEINYSWEGKISSGRFIYWNKNNGCMIKIGTEKGITLIQKVETVNPKVGNWETVYKTQK